MEKIICADYDAMSTRAAESVRDIIRENPQALLSFPGGDTPLGMVRAFTKMVNAGEIDISKARFVMLDEWVGLDATNPGSCAAFLQENLFAPLQYPFAEICLLNGKAPDMDAELAAHDAFIRKCGGITVSMLGIGMNGHLGFNEDGVDFSLRSHKIPLAPKTREVMCKYFGGQALPLTHGITQGISQIMEAKYVFVLANGEKKADIVKSSLCGEITNKVPASVLQNHPHCCYILDSAAASKL